MTNPIYPKVRKKMNDQLKHILKYLRLWTLLANWDGVAGADPQLVKAYTWDGAKLTPTFTVDFRALELGRPHIMRFGRSRSVDG